jgi:DNA-binding CsgD family transcriptional regulator
MANIQQGVTAQVERDVTPDIAMPRGLEAFRFEAGGEVFALIEWPSAAPSPETGPAALAALTPAEAAVAELAVAGRSNAEIARERGSSPRTVANQLANVFRKLGVASRLELYAYVGGGAAAGR